ncbi:MAG: hypothetical protein JWQ09_4519 [Segetibacter sp.]|nr:hypothetical protein [Segetibacter sp.]
MSTVQTLELYKILRKYFQNEEDATRVVEDLQFVIDKKFEEKKSELSTKQDIIELKLELKDLRIELFNKLNDHFKWTIATRLAVAGIIIAIIKLL